MTKQPALLITGGAGFIGSNFIHYYLSEHADASIVNIDKLTYAGNQTNLSGIEDDQRYHWVHGDIADEKVVSDVFKKFDIQGVVHFAAESHVDKSIANAKPFIISNVLGTGTLLEAARQDWEEKGMLDKRRFHYISTDEVYGSLGKEGTFNEQSPYNPSNPYSATKAGANMLVKSYFTTYGMNVVLSSCSNNYGPRQHKEKLIPTIIRKALALDPIPIYGTGENVRDWLYVEDHCRAIDRIFHDGATGQIYNVGGRNEQTNLKLAKLICEALDEIKPDLTAHADIHHFSELITFVEDRPGHDLRYAVDDSKIRNKLGWKPSVSFEEGLRRTVEWYVNQPGKVVQ
ncbi:dTDP-glucose 4,6-dehydratase [Halobacillus salinarum]|uniref:dTDP-glucose 4,6-dehydratase n=1 Tax=Halobacillus salinarum TaxID=2932257 RepID=A0ABY4EK67_9BACI|nr:dTDP-glucose 4,6-dehydratase [Halobacillus salinarum]UOQ44024.1 dTDP-glucose 4,6-dehydratase [Halobacillus salinarum]